MADDNQDGSQAQDSGAEAIDTGSYELLRDRLGQQAAELRKKAQELNASRLGIFGGTEMVLIGNERIRTENNCVPRDVVSIGGHLLFGYNVFMGLRKETKISDVFSVQTFSEADSVFSFSEVPLEDPSNVLSDERFQKDFFDLYRYYKDARLIQLRSVGSRVLAVFQVGSTIHDVKAFHFLLDPQGNPTYEDDSGARHNVFPNSHDFEWIETGRKEFIYGRHPHVNILDKVFVETVGGDLTVKIEDNTEDGVGIYSEEVDNKDQTLDDGKIFYAELGTLILLKILPFGEKDWRYLVYNTRTQVVDRIDAIGQACVQLPEDHGIIFPGGYYLQSGETKTFEADTTGMVFMRTIKSPNGEDVLYVFYEHNTGHSVLLPYNMIRKEVQNPIHCHGYSLFRDGKLVVFKADTEEATRVHPMQIWQTAFCSDDYAAEQSDLGEHAGTYLFKIGNADLVRGISDSHSICRMVENQKASTQNYEDIIAACRRLLDAHHWLDHAEAKSISKTVGELRQSAELVVGEFEKVQVIQAAALGALEEAEEEQRVLLGKVRPDVWKTVDAYVDMMAQIRRRRGHLITVKEMRYMNVARVEELEREMVDAFEGLTEQAVKFLLKDDALAAYRQQYETSMAQIEEVTQSNHAIPIQEKLDTTSSNLDLLTEVVSGLQIEDPAARTTILEGISEVFGLFNRAKATLAGKRKDLLGKEGVAEFGAQFKLFGQSVQSAMALADTPEKCDEQLTRLMVQLEDLEARFSEFDQFLADLASKREEVYDAFGAKKQQLLDERQRRADNIEKAADRILSGVGRRSGKFETLDDLNAFFASDAMVLKLRDLTEQLVELGDDMRAEEIIGKLKSARDDAARSQRDKTELFEGGGDNIIRFGKHRFAVNTQPLELTLLVREGEMHGHLTGTGYYEKIDDDRLEAARAFWNQSLVSETNEVYRGEYLAASILFEAESNRGELSVEDLRHAQLEDRLLEVVREKAASRYDEGYDRGVHDHDAALILDKVLGLGQTAGLLRFAPTPRALACLFWAFYDDAEAKQRWRREALNLGELRVTFGRSNALETLANDLFAALSEFLANESIEHTPDEARIAGSYLTQQLAEPEDTFVVSGEAARLRDALMQHLELGDKRVGLERDLATLEKENASLETRLSLIGAWCEAFIGHTKKDAIKALRPVLVETAVLVLTDKKLERSESGALSELEVTDLLGQHDRISGRKMKLRLDEFLERLGNYAHRHVPGFRAYRQLRTEVTDRERHALRLQEFKPRVMSSFVRNKLINDVYLPIIGDNLAKQIGAQGAEKRTDLMGLLLLISPPGYGKTTLMEYIANRLGLVFMKINGPALGHSVVSIDPAEAPNATARQEVEKLNLGLEMGNNVMLYVDDIQHTNPEFLQKFISLCDGQRRIEGVWRGQTKTYDLRGKRFCVCMAGNPYTESGDKFQIPDMLANRADVYNLGDVLSGRGDSFALSYIENSITSNRVLAPLATREQSDIYALARLARGEDVPTSEIKHGYSKVEQEEITSLLQKMFRCRDVLLKVNQEYIASAAQDDKYRREPKFQLQGSYRNMNKLAEKVVSAMNDDELEALIDDHYQGEAQTLTTGAESNLLKLNELRGTLTADELTRWEEIKKGYARHQLNQGTEDDPVARVTTQLSLLNDHLSGVKDSIESAADSQGSAGVSIDMSPVADALKELREGFAKLSAPAIDMSPLADALKSLSEGKEPVASTTSNPDLAPYLQQLNEVLANLGNRESVTEPKTDGLERYAQRLEEMLKIMATHQIKSGAKGSKATEDKPFSGLSDGHVNQLAAVRNLLRPVLEEAEARIKGDSKSFPAQKVWKQLRDALEVLEGIR